MNKEQLNSKEQIPVVTKNERGQNVYTLEGFREYKYNFLPWKIENIERQNREVIPDHFTDVIVWYKKAREENPALYQEALRIEEEIVSPWLDKFASVVNTDEFYKTRGKERDEILDKLLQSAEAKKMAEMKETRLRVHYAWYLVLKKHGAEERKLDMRTHPLLQS